MKVTLQIQVSDIDQYQVPMLGEFQSWTDMIAKNEGEVCVRIVDNDESASLNSRYRHLPHATNVLSFPMESPVPLTIPVLGDIVITAPLIRSQAEEQGKNIKSHWAHIFVHGLLHLMGYDHQAQEQAEIMEAYEIKVMNLLGFANPYG